MPSKKAPKKSDRRAQKRAVPEPTPLNLDDPHRFVYEGKCDKLVISIDIGTTCSAASLCLLKPRRFPNLELVSGWPGQTNEQDHKVPSVIYYDQNGEARGWGAETTNLVFKARAAEENWVRVEWFKLSFKPPHCATGMDRVPPLPHFLNAQQVFSDFVSRMFLHIKSYFAKHHAGGNELWEKLSPTTEMVFTIPNGWELRQQYQIRRAAVDAGFLGTAEVVIERGRRNVRRGYGQPRNPHERLMKEALSRIRFVSESEAAMVYAADSGYVDSWLEVGNSVIVCDAGGGTIDISVYHIRQELPLELREQYASKCIVSGAVLVNQKARDYITDKIKGTPWDTEKRIEQLMEYFERDTKKLFTFPMDKEYSVGPGGSTEAIEKANIRDGMLFIPAADLETFFEPTLDAIKQGIQDIWKRSGKTIKNVIMVGGLMNSSYAFKQLELWGEDKGVKFTKPDGTMAKAVSHGALLWYLAKPVKGYIIKFHYGSDVCLRADEFPEEVIKGREILYEVDGRKLVERGWETIAPMGEILDPDLETYRAFEKYFDEDEPVDASIFEEKIYVCREEEPPRFIADAHGRLSPSVEHICSLIVDLQKLFNLTPWQTNKQTGKKYKCLKFNIAIMNDGYDLDAYSFWNHQGKAFYGDAKVIVPAISESRSPSPS